MNRYFLFLIFLGISLSVNSQEEREVSIDNEILSYVIYEDNPIKLYKYNLSASTMVYAVTQAEVGLFLDADYKFSDEMRFSAMMAKSIKTNTSLTSILGKHSAFEVFPKVHFRYFSRSKFREMKLVLDEKRRTVYYVKDDFLRNVSLDFDVGVNYLSHYNANRLRVDSTITETGDIQTERLYLLNTNNLSLSVGTSVSLSRRIKYTSISKQEFDFLRVHRFSFNLLFGGSISNTYTALNNEGNTEIARLKEPVDRDRLPLGFRFSYQQQTRPPASGMTYLILGIDVGANPSYQFNVNSGRNLIGETVYVNFRVGLGLGKKEKI